MTRANDNFFLLLDLLLLTVSWFQLTLEQRERKKFHHVDLINLLHDVSLIDTFDHRVVIMWSKLRV